MSDTITAVDIDADTLSACLTKWLDDHDGLPALVAEPVRAGRLKSTPEAPKRLPYAQMSCELDHRDLAGTNGSWHDYRKVTIQMWATPRAQASFGLALMLAQFNLRTVLVFPSEARFIRWMPADGGTLEEDKDVKEGHDVWLATVTGVVWSIRTT